MKKLLFLLVGLCMIACRLEDKPLEKFEGTLHVVVTTGIIHDCLTNIVGDSMEVSAIMGPGTDPHMYKPTPADVEMLDEADIIVANGLHLEGKMAQMLKKYGKEKPVFLVSDGINKKDIIKSANFQDAHDPHIWFDTDIWMDGMRYISDELGKIDTSSKAYFKENFKQYREEVFKLNYWIEKEFNALDKENRILITSHDAFSYFGRRYGIEVKGIQGVSTLSEVGLKEISDMVNFIIENKVKAIFIETSTSQKTAQSIVDGCQARGYNVEIKGPLYSDALGEPDSEAGNYLGMIRANVTQIVEGLK
jgi:manganese/zinc/iron transport system substrate-binding protein